MRKDFCELRVLPLSAAHPYRPRIRIKAAWVLLDVNTDILPYLEPTKTLACIEFQMTQSQKLFTPMQVGDIKLAHRVVMAPLT